MITHSTRRRPRGRAVVRRLFLTGVVAALAATVPALASAASAAPASPSASTATARGSWQVSAAGHDRWLVSWRSPSRLPIRSDRATIVRQDGEPVGVSTTAADDRTVQCVIVSATRPDPDGLAVMLSGARLDRVASAPASGPSSSYTPEAAAVPPLPVDPGQPGPYATVSSDYVRPSVKVAGMPQPIEMVGHVVEPAPDAQTGPRPLVLFLHGRHDPCYKASPGKPNYDWPCHGTMREVPSQLGYEYMQRLLASQGFTTVSIRVNGINAQDAAVADGGASARATIVARQLDYWATIADQHQVDLNRVVLVGHSRGGEGVDRASIRIPLSAPYRIVGQVLIAPTDFGNQTAPYVPTVTLLPYCDGDVSDLEGQHFTDIARDISPDDRSLKSSVLILGANHNFFNTEWTPGISQAPSVDDWNGPPNRLCGTETPGRLTASQQRDVGQAYVAGAVSTFTRPSTATSLLPMFDGSRVRVRSAGKAVVYSHSVGGDRDLRRPGSQTTLTLAHGAESHFCTGISSYDYRPELCGSELGDVVTPQWSQVGQQPVQNHRFWQLSWTARDQSAGLRLDRPLDLRSRVLDLRTIVDFRRGPAAVKIRLTDAAGASATFTPDGGSVLHPLPYNRGGAFQVGKLWGQDVRIDPASAAARIDLARVSSIEIVADSPSGQLWVADLASTAQTLPQLAAERVPTISIGSRTVKEGNHGGTVVVDVPFRLSRPMDRPGRFQVATVGPQPGSTRLLTIDLAPGQRSGSIQVGYESDRLDSPDRSATAILAAADTNVMTDHYTGRLVVLDDDPTPKVTITRVKDEITEGESAQWRVSLSSRVGYEPTVRSTVVRGPGKDLTGADVPAGWLLRHAQGTDPTKTLAALHASVYALLRSGQRSVVVSIPVRKDGAAEPGEAVTLRITMLGTTSRLTVGVAESH